MMSNKKKKVFNNLYDKHIDKIYRFVFLKVNSKETAEDLTSEVFIKFWKALGRPYISNPGTYEIENPKALLYKIAKDMVIDHYRQSNTVRLVSLEGAEDILGGADNTEERIDADLDMERIKTALSQLNDDYQNVIIWHYLDDLSIPEISEVADKSENAVRVTLSRALEKLREIV